jgi:hypothetical protein
MTVVKHMKIQMLKYSEGKNEALWSIDAMPELTGLSPEQKKQALQFCVKKYAFKLWQTWLCIFVVASLSLVPRSIFNFTGMIADAMTGGISGMAGWLTTINALRPRLHDYARKNFTNL